MNSGSNRFSDGSAQRLRVRRRSARPRIIYVLIVLIFASLIGQATLAFSLPSLGGWLLFLYFICLFALSVRFLIALFRRKWNELAIFLAIWPIVLFPFYTSGSLRWLYVEAFRFHASPTEEYLARCKSVEFVENGTKQMLGKCDSLHAGGDAALLVFYDTTGEFILPVSQRSPEWRAAMEHFSPHAVLVDTEGRAQKLFGNFYEIVIRPDEFDGDNSGY